MRTQEVEIPGHPDRPIPLRVVDDVESLVDRDRLLNSRHTPDPPYWALVWIGARALAARMLEVPPPPGARVLDLGCGLGLSGIAAALGGAEVTFADNVAVALEFAESSAALNGIGHHHCQVVDFCRDHLDRRFDLILAADIVYEPQAYRPLAEFLDQHLDEGGTILLSESLRADAKRFLELMYARGFTGQRETVWVIEEGRRERTWLHHLLRRTSD
ncbi:MAG: 50S ribosomal protein L11 methyltransferase [Deltaproteobacteria bacterium]